MRVKKVKNPHNRIWIFAALMLLLVFSLAGLDQAFSSTLALEQAPRCAMEEHIHTQECYSGDFLICGQKMHSHGENCYLVLLKDNDINGLLSLIDSTEEKSLETLIGNTVIRTTWLEKLLPEPAPEDQAEASPGPVMSPSVSPSVLPSVSPIPSATPSIAAAMPLHTFSMVPSTSVTLMQQEPEPISNEDIARLNEIAAVNEIEPAVVLNENLSVYQAPESSATETELLDQLLINNAIATGNISTLSVEPGGAPEGANNTLYFYIYVADANNGAGAWKYVTSLRYTTSGNYRVVNTTELQNYLTTTIPELSGYDYTLYHNSSPTSTRNWSEVTQSGNYTRFGRSNSTAARYVRIVDSDDRYNGTTLKFYTVTLQDGDGNTLKTYYVRENYYFTIPELSGYQRWTEITSSEAEKPVHSTGAVLQITGTTTLRAVKNYTVYYKNLAGQDIMDPDVVDPGTGENGIVRVPVLDMPPGYEDYCWILEGSDGAPVSGSVAINGDITFIAVPKYHTVTYYNADGTQDGQPLTLDYYELYTLKAPPVGSSAWIDLDTGSVAEQTVRITRSYRFQAAATCTVTYLDAYGNVLGTEQVLTGSYVLNSSYLPSGYAWKDENGEIHQGGDTVVITGDRTFTASRTLTLEYDVNFTEIEAQYFPIVQQPPAPTIAGTSSETGTQVVSTGEKAVLYNVSSRSVVAETGYRNQENNHNFNQAGYFVGWQVEETDEILLPSATYSYEELAALDTNGDGAIALTGIWNTEMRYTANFTIRYDISSLDSSQLDRNQYTDSLFTTYAGIPEGVSMTDGRIYFGSEVEEEGLANDILIRSLEGERTGTTVQDGTWIYEIPPDEYFFDQLKADEGVANGELIVDGLRVKVSELNSDIFTIRWYVAKYYNNDGWHIDGKLVRKVGKIVVTKTFDGRSDFIADAQDGFYILAQAGSLDDSGNFVDSSTRADIRLVTGRAAAEGDTTMLGYDSRTERTNPTNGNVQVVYSWVIPNVGAGELWNLEEQLVSVDSAVGFGEWTIVDSANQQSGNGQGTRTMITGVTFPKDASSVEWLRAEFTNVYYSKNSILLRKVDGLTGQKLDGAQFQLWQSTDYGEVLMTFDLKESVGADGNVYRTYIYRLDGAGQHAVLNSDGTEINIAVEEFSYGNGPIVVREIKSPTGYIKAENEVIVGYAVDDNGDVMTDDTGTPVVQVLNAEESAGYATFENGLLIVRNFANTVDLTAQKAWRNCSTDEWADSVVVQLLANGSASQAAAVLPPGVSTIQTLNVIRSGGTVQGYETYTWDDLPVYVGGREVTWSVKELQIGTEELKADGTFPNWYSYVSLPVYSADRTSAVITVTNNPKAGTELRVVKMDTGRTKQLSGAVFTIADRNGTILNTATTDENGELVFHNLKYNTTYIVTETSPPPGYHKNPEPIYIVIAEDGTVSVSRNNPYAEPGSSAYSLRVLNLAVVPLPETGGHGTIGYYAMGLAMIFLALSVTILPKLRHKGRYQMRN